MEDVYKNTPEALVANVIHLISLPNVYTKLEKTLKEPNHTRNDIAKIISIDPALSARILRIINSSYYGLPNPVQNIAIAVNLLGEYDLRNMVLVTSVVNSVTALTDRGIDIHSFWQHSIRCAIAAKLLASLKAYDDPEFLFLSGILHDLGRLIIYKNERELSETVSWYVTTEGRERYQVEQELLGFDHAFVGFLLAESWCLPAKLGDIIKCHHQPELSTDNQLESKLVSLADLLVHYLEKNVIETIIDLNEWPKIKAYLEELDIKPEILTDLLNEVLEKSQSIEEIICDI